MKILPSFAGIGFTTAAYVVGSNPVDILDLIAACMLAGVALVCFAAAIDQ